MILSKEKSNFNSRVLDVILIDGARITHQNEILIQEMRLFTELYRSRHDELSHPSSDYLDSLELPR